MEKKIVIFLLVILMTMIFFFVGSITSLFFILFSIDEYVSFMLGTDDFHIRSLTIDRVVEYTRYTNRPTFGDPLDFESPAEIDQIFGHLKDLQIQRSSSRVRFGIPLIPDKTYMITLMLDSPYHTNIALGFTIHTREHMLDRMYFHGFFPVLHDNVDYILSNPRAVFYHYTIFRLFERRYHYRLLISQDEFLNLGFHNLLNESLYSPSK
jgi:hypothetical protein